MTVTKPVLAIAATTLLALAACDAVESLTAPIVPQNTPGPIAQDSALNGVYNLLRSECGEMGSEKSLVIDGRKFLFPRAECAVVRSERQPSQTRVTLNCKGGSGSAGNRVVDLQTRADGTLRLTEDSLTLTYFQCMKAPASTDSLVGQTM
ncbi:MAG TPA: hypothetical protein PLI13_09690 [Paracoccus sp. (in: a-proteobacteria)]|nr:hypothetical protein [Paracoccus sp. (in: a-proteobacteria)]HRM74953.1 hypothetical protein [Paracoccus sp. (in: a-proteobacteria)]